MTPVGETRSIWSVRAEGLLQKALEETRDAVDAIPTVTAALTALRIEAGEAPGDSLDGYPFPGEDEKPTCTCPPDLRARGGFRSTCPVSKAGLDHESQSDRPEGEQRLSEALVTWQTGRKRGWIFAQLGNEHVDVYPNDYANASKKDWAGAGKTHCWRIASASRSRSVGGYSVDQAEAKRQGGCRLLGMDPDSTYAVKVVKPGHPNVLIGPIYFKHQVDQAMRTFDSMRTSTMMPEGTTWESVPFDPAVPHIPQPPNTIDELAYALVEEPEGPPGSAFPDLWSRLHAFNGYETAAALWGPACSHADHLMAGDDEDD